MTDNNAANSSIFDAFQDGIGHDGVPEVHDDVIQDDGATGAAFSTQKAIDLLMIGIILLSIVIVVDCCIRTYFICRSRKQKRLVVPSPEDVMAAIIVNADTNNRQGSTSRRSNALPVYEEEMGDGDSV